MKLHALFFQPPIENNYIGHIASEVYRDKIFEPFLPQNKAGSVCVEIGANVGIVSYYFAQYFDKVYAIEPSLEHFETLTQMINYNELTNVEAHKLAIYLNSGEYPFFHNKNKTMFSLHTAVNDNTSSEEKVKAVTIDKFFEDNNIKHCNLMKIDCEGSEHEIIGSPGFKNIADKIDNVVVEWHAWSGRPMSQLKDALELRGFKVEQMPSSADILVGRK
jgi:FkbM family methyltransferase